VDTGFLDPWTTFLRFDESSTMRTHRYSDRFSAVRVETTGRLPDAVHKSSSVQALLVSMSLRPVAAPDYRLWVNGKVVPTGRIPAFRANVIDLDAQPAMWADRGVHYVHFHLRRSCIDETAADLGYDRVGGFRLAVAHEDIALAQITRSIVPFLGRSAPPPIAFDQLELILAAHVAQRFGGTKQRRAGPPSGLSAWQRRRSLELLRENLAGRVRLADLACACDLSVSHFARSFKASFGVGCHRWLLERRVEHARELLARTDHSLVDIASRSGFGDQAAFTRTFHRLVGVTPGRFRRDHRRHTAESASTTQPAPDPPPIGPRPWRDPI
jgi:AraC family transcriptional regulator